MTDTTPHERAEPDLEWAGPTWAESARFIAVFVVLLAAAFLLMAATHQPGCGGG